MEELDKRTTNNHLSDEELLIREVIREDAELLYLDSYLRELFNN